ncbi:hypothetical protein [Verrucosispora sp. WMMC514]|uniref:hypothetical protein n=1 Tax=Verrucosispora sp. WMMC514 TaxID=3015156 RepID=UPI00248B5525|nr:hypothetical protein [Verrucosispora sp. WMMC514]WBB94176.1 hypothetical protein O7597_15105 [Verrucosispora sp. WMMC514]
MRRVELVQAVAVGGDERPRWCDGCLTSAGYDADVWAMLPSGLILLGTFRACDTCDPDGQVVCAFCPTAVTDGGRFFAHIRDRHAEGSGRAGDHRRPPQPSH